MQNKVQYRKCTEAQPNPPNVVKEMWKDGRTTQMANGRLK